MIILYHSAFIKKIKLIILLTIVCSLLITAYIGCSYININVISEPSSIKLPKVLPVEKIIAKVKAYNHTFKKNETVFSIMHGMGLSGAQISKLVTAAQQKHALTRIKPGQTLTLIRNASSGELLSLQYTIDGKSRLLVKKDPQGYRTLIQELPLTMRLRNMSVRISSSLYEDGVSAGLSAQKILELTDIFPWDINFFTDLHENDSFRVVYEENLKDGKVMAEGKILAAEITKNGMAYQAFYYETEKDRGAYYDRCGKSLQKQFLKSPLRFRRITSDFSKHRFHPILQEYRPHYGIDYAAPIGTAVEAVADGVVTFSGWKNGFGKCIEMRHGKNYISCYGHLSGFARGTRAGRAVSQGDVIGYVGATGMATGPHLDFRLCRAGRPINPLSVKNIISHEITLKSMDGFIKTVQLRMAQLDPEHNSGTRLARR
jgi:murein DD-endopeptidase MepM/ murein hydrolase activator NlpD